MKTILVTGGTGTLGRQLVPQLLNAGYSVRVLSRNGGEARQRLTYVSGNLETGEGVAEAVKGVEIVLHCAGSQEGDDIKAEQLVRAAKGSSVQHLVYISVVGADRVPVVSNLDKKIFGYFAAKRAAELTVMNSGVPWTIMRATQFHDLLFLLAETMGKMPFLPVFAGFRYQPVDSSEVADRLAQLAMGEPAGLVEDLGGPHIYKMSEVMRAYLRALGKWRLIIPVWLPGKAAQAHRAGANITPEHATGKRTWEAFLTERLGSRK